MKIEYTLTPLQEKYLTTSAEAAKQTTDQFCQSYITTALDDVVKSLKENQLSQINTVFSNSSVIETLAKTKIEKVAEIEAAIASVKPAGIDEKPIG